MKGKTDRRVLRYIHKTYPFDCRWQDEESQCTVTNENNIPVYTVTLRALVAEEKGSPDHAFKFEVSLRNPVLLDRGNPLKYDELLFKITATQHCYLYVFNLLSNDTVLLILPNKYLRNNIFTTEKKEKDFERDIRQVGIRFTAALPKGLGRVKKALYVIALKDNIEYKSDHFT